MEALQHSLASLSLQSSAPASSFRAQQSVASKQIPLAIVSRSTKPVSSAHFALQPQASQVHGSLRFNPLASRVHLFGGGGRGHRAVVIMSATAAGGYAGALAEVGQANKILELLNADVEKLGAYLEDPAVYEFFTNPVINDENKRRIVKAIAKEANFQTYTLNLLNLMVDRKRTALLREVVKEFEEIYNELTDTQVAVVTSAIKLDTSQLALIAKKIQSLSNAKNVRMKNVVDPSLIAGFIVKFGKDGSRLIDMSVKGQLDLIASKIDFAQKVGAL